MFDFILRAAVFYLLLTNVAWADDPTTEADKKKADIIVVNQFNSFSVTLSIISPFAQKNFDQWEDRANEVCSAVGKKAHFEYYEGEDDIVFEAFYLCL